MKQATALLGGLTLLDFAVLFSLPAAAIKVGLLMAPMVLLYPFMKRFYNYPQLLLGLIFNSGVMMGYATLAASHAISWNICLPFYLGGILWTMVYDSIYAF